MNKINGKKTYITAITGILISAGHFFGTGNFGVPVVVDFVQEIVPLLAVIFLRHGVAKVGK